MKVRLSFLSSIIMVVVLSLSACIATPITPQATAVPATPLPPTRTPSQSQINKEIVLKMVESLKAGDVEGSMSYFAENAIAYIVGFPPTGIEVYKGKAEIGDLWKDSVDNHFEWEVKDDTKLSPYTVNLMTKTWHDFTRQIGVAPLEYHDMYDVIDGKITTYVSWLTEESLARFKEGFAKNMPPEPTPTLSSDPPVSEITVTVAGGTCSTDAITSLKAGQLKVNFIVKDTNKSKYALMIATLDEGKDMLDLMASTYGDKPSWGYLVLFKEVLPDSSQTYTLTLKEKPVYLICWAQTPVTPIGNAGPFMVVP